MARIAWSLSLAVLWGGGSLLFADEQPYFQRQYGNRGITYNWYAEDRGYVPRSLVVYPGYYASWGYPLTMGAAVSPGYYWPAPMPQSVMPNSPLSAPPNALPAQMSPWTNLPGPKIDAAEKPIVLSSAAARLKSLKLQADGDQFLRRQQWYHANVNYKQAISAAEDQAEAHLRYGIGLSVLKRFDEALKQFKRAIYIDPTLPRSALTLETLFGPDSRLVRSSMMSAAADWLEEDLGNPERLFVMGVLMHFNQDDRAQELFSAALPISNNAAYIAAFLPEGKSPEPHAGTAPSSGESRRLSPVVPRAPSNEAPPAPGLAEEPAAPRSKPAIPDGPTLVPPSPSK